jgi:hypothetical protein
VYHEAGFDALMTGICWFKLLTILEPNKTFPGVKAILANDMYNTMDKNRVPMASIKTSMDLNQILKEEQTLLTDSKEFLFVIQGVPIYYMTEEI